MPTALQFHPDQYGGFYTTPLFWDCSCEEQYIHPHTLTICPACSDAREDAPDARVEEVLRCSSELDQELICQIEEEMTCLGMDIFGLMPLPGIPTEENRCLTLLNIDA